ncbi:unnamed protein product [Closterium sp. NIES-65]|nr:unnamed protein product [Closterium sp. NIES-65]
MYALSTSVEGDSYLRVPPDPGIASSEAAALGASASAGPSPGEASALGAGESAASGACAFAPSGTVSTEALHTFTLDSSASRCFFWDRTALAQLPRPVAVSLADPLGFRPAEAPLQTLHMDVWGPAHVRGQGGEHYFLLVVDDYTRYTTVFPLRTKGEDPDVLIPWIRATRLLLERRFHTDLPILQLHYDRGGEFSSGLLRAFCQGEGIEQTFTLPASPQKNGVVERRIGLVMEVARTSLIHAAAPQFSVAVCGPVRRASAQPLAPCLRSGDLADTALDGRVPCVFLGFPPGAPGWQFYHPTSRRVLSSQDVTFDESVPFYRLFPYHTAPLPPPPLFLTPVEPVEVAVDTGPARGTEPERAAPGGAETGGAETGGAEPEGAEPAGAGPGGAEPGGAEPGGVERGGAEPGGAEPGGAEPGGVEPGGAEPGGAETGGPAPGGALSSQQLREWYSQHCRCRRGAVGAGGARGAGDEGAGATIAGVAADPGVGARGAAGAVRGVGASGTVGAGLEALPLILLEVVELTVLLVRVLLGVLELALLELLEVLRELEPVLGVLVLSLLVLGALYGRSRTLFRSFSKFMSRPASPIRAARTGRRVPRQRLPALPGMHRMALRPSTTPQRVPLPSPPTSSLPALADPESDSLRAASPIVTRLLATVVADPSFESTTASALVSELVDFAAHCRLDYAASLVAESESVCPPSVGGECALGTDVVEDRQEEFECFAADVPHLVSKLIAPEGDPDAPDIPTPRSNAEAIEGPYSSQCQRQGVDFFQTFSPTPKMTTLRVLLHVATQRDYELHSLDFSTAFLQGKLHEEIWLRRPPRFTGSFPPGTQWSLRRPVYGLRQAPHEWHDTLRTTPAALGFATSTADPSLFLRTDTSLPSFYILVCIDDLVFATADTEGLTHVKSEL